MFEETHGRRCLMKPGRRHLGAEENFMPSNDNHGACDTCHRPTRSDGEIDRREMLRVVGMSAGTVSALVVLPACGQATGSAPTGPVSVGNVSALAVGKMLVMSNVVVARDASGVYGMSAVCTHEGCLLDDGPATVAAGLNCSCHGSTFDGAGAVTRGPARTALQHYAVTIASDGSMVVDGSQPVAASTRTAPG
jgi:Rieske Fe-S protein